MRIYDVSRIVYTGMEVWPGDPPVSVMPAKSIERGDASNLSRLDLGSHTGTHVDAPRHFIPGAPGVDSLAPAILVGKARLCQLPEAHHLDRALLEGLGLGGVSRLLLGTRNANLPVGTDYAYLSGDAAAYLVALGVKLVGIDYLSIEEHGRKGHPIHQTLLSAGVVIIEGLDFKGVPPGDYELMCLPLKLKDADGAPARVFLRELS